MQIPCNAGPHYSIVIVADSSFSNSTRYTSGLEQPSFSYEMALQVVAPKISVTSESTDEPLKCTVKFQCGLLRETETFLGDDVRYLCTESVLEYVSDMLYFKVSIDVLYILYIYIVIITVHVL